MGSQYRLFRILCLLLVGATLLEAHYYEKPPICDYPGARLRPSYASFNQSGLLSANQCGALCLAAVKCTSFSLSMRTCHLYHQYVSCLLLPCWLAYAWKYIIAHTYGVYACAFHFLHTRATYLPMLL